MRPILGLETVPKNKKNAILEPNGLLKAANTATYHTPYWALREYVGHPYRVFFFLFSFADFFIFFFASLV